jgi:hypothetical protein
MAELFVDYLVGIVLGGAKSRLIELFFYWEFESEPY